MKPHKVTSQWWDHATLWDSDDPLLQDAGHTTDGGRVFGITRVRYDECDRYGCTPVAVIDPEDREAVNSLAARLRGQYKTVTFANDDLQDALREFAKPSKPTEPMGKWAVVMANGATHVRAAWASDRPWSRVGTEHFAAWAEMDVESIEFKGVTP